jgi:LysR family hydrogen peroxide-inducible transcriptional activator
MNYITLRQLHYFHALARESHFGRAAEACAVTQPALSMQIKELEDALGVVLIERDARKARLTKFGEEAAARVDQILRSVDELGNLARASGGELAGHFRIGMIPTIAPYLLPALIGDLAQSHPDVELHMREAVTSKLIQELAEGRIDGAILALPISEPSLTEVALFSENFLLVRPAADDRLPVPASEKLREMKLLLLEEGHCFREQALSFCKMPRGRSREAMDASSLSTLVQMVSAGLGVTLIPEMAVRLETRSAAVAVARFKDPQPSRIVGMVWRRTTPLARQLLQLSDVVQRSAASLRVKQKSEPAARNVHFVGTARKRRQKR